MDPVHGVGPGDHQELVTALELGAPEVVGGELGQLEVGTHGAVEDDHPLGGGAEVGGSGGVGVGHGPPRIPAARPVGARFA